MRGLVRNTVVSPDMAARSFFVVVLILAVASYAGELDLFYCCCLAAVWPPGRWWR